MCALRRAPPLACVRWEQRERERMCGAAPAWRDLMWAGGCVCEGGDGFVRGDGFGLCV